MSDNETIYHQYSLEHRIASLNPLLNQLSSFLFEDTHAVSWTHPLTLISHSLLSIYLLLLQVEQKLPCAHMVQSESVSYSTHLTSRNRCVLTTHSTGFNVLGVGEFILKKSFSSLLGIPFGTNLAFSSTFPPKLLWELWPFCLLFNPLTILSWHCFTKCTFLKLY